MEELLKLTKSIATGLLKFLVASHFLIIITFVFLRFLPGSFVEDEFIVVESSNRLTENFFFELKKYLINIYHFDFGNSYQNPQTTVKEIILNRYSYSFKLLFISFAVIVLFGFIVSFLSLLNKKVRRFTRVLINVLNTIPLIVLLPVLIYLCCFVFKLAPTRFNSEDNTSYIFAIVLITLKPIFQLSQLTIQKWVEESHSQYNVTAKAKGFSKAYILLNHSFRNIIPSFINFSQSIFLTIISGNFLVESFYSIPGVGLSFVEAMANRDLPLILGCVLFLGTTFFFVNSMTDIGINFLQKSNRSSG